jgi:antiviral defense system Shedu protein SduA
MEVEEVERYRRPFRQDLSEAEYARRRLSTRTYVSRSFRLKLPGSRDFGQPARYVHKVFDEDGMEALDPVAEGVERTEETVDETPRGRKQVQVARDAGQVREILIQRVPRSGDSVEHLLRLDRDGSRRLVNLIRSLDHIPVEGGAAGVRVDDDLIRDLFSDPTAVATLYGRDPEKFREVIANDASASDLIAIAHRKAVVERFRELLGNSEAFDAAVEEAGGGPEKVWQNFIEANPWILGITLAGQLLTSWSDERLEQVVAGFSVAGEGRRADALLRTNGAIRSLVFAEIKHHRTPLLGEEYRREAWAISPNVSGGVGQVQQTIHRARHEIRDRLYDRDQAGAETGEVTFLVRPRSYLIVGDLNQLRGEGGVHPGRHRSFELYRRNLYEPEIVTFDELLARAEWHVSLADPD